MRKSRFCKIYILITFLCCLSVSLVSAQPAESYTARTYLRVLLYPDNDPTVIRTPDFDRETQKQFCHSRATLMKHEAFLTELLKRDRIRKTNWFKNLTDGSKTITPEVLAELEKNLKVEPLEDMGFITVSMSCAEPQEAADIVNEAVDLFVAQQRDLRVSEVRSKLVELERRRQSIQRELDLTEKALDDVRASTGFTDLEERDYPSPQEVRLNRLLERKDELLIRLARIGNADDSLKDSVNAELRQVEKMLADASEEKRALDTAKIRYQQRTRVRDHIVFELDQVKTLIQKYRILAEDHDVSKVQITGRAVAPIRPD